jgi:UPF0755 protein
MTTKSSKPTLTKKTKRKLSGRFWLVCLVFLATSLAAIGWGVSRWWLWAIAPPSSFPVNGFELFAFPNLGQNNRQINGQINQPEKSGIKNSDPKIEPKIIINIPPGAPLQLIGDRLERAGVIRSSLALRLWVRISEAPSPQAGNYQFSTNQSLSEVVAKMQSSNQLEVRFTIAEGWSIAQIGAYFEQQGYFAAKDFAIAATKVQNYKAKYPWLSQNPISNLEGYLFPDTYQLPPTQITPERVINLMLNQFEQAALPLYQKHLVQKPNLKTAAKNSSKTKPVPKFSLHEWVTFASMVEKEAVLSEERAQIAGVFANRLRLGMRLESDPTVEYGLGIKQTVAQPLTYKQVATPNPYNTYFNFGLPPGAIAAPGLASLTASLQPANTEDLFFVARYDGSHIFSRTYEEHKLAIRKVENSLDLAK